MCSTELYSVSVVEAAYTDIHYKTLWTVSSFNQSIYLSDIAVNGNAKYNYTAGNATLVKILQNTERSGNVIP